MILERQYLRLAACLCLVLIGLGAAGCLGTSAGDNLPRQPVAGIVLVDGRPLSRGSILFFPAHHPILGTAVSGGDAIHNGRFSIPREKGLVPGRYRIAISEEGRHRPLGERGTEPAKSEIVADEIIPDRFNIDTELEVEVKAGGIKELKIEIDSK